MDSIKAVAHFAEAKRGDQSEMFVGAVLSYRRCMVAAVLSYERCVVAALRFGPVSDDL